MQYLYQICFQVFFLSFCSAQNATDTICYSEKFSGNLEEKQEIFVNPTIEASFKGGVIKWNSFIAGNISWSNIIKSIPNTIKFFEDSVIMKFVVSRNGLLSNLEILYSGNDAIKNEAIRILKLSCSKWITAVASSGRAINSWHKEKIYFLWDNRNEKLICKTGVMF